MDISQGVTFVIPLSLDSTGIGLDLGRTAFKGTTTDGEECTVDGIDGKPAILDVLVSIDEIVRHYTNLCSSTDRADGTDPGANPGIAGDDAFPHPEARSDIEEERIEIHLAWSNLSGSAPDFGCNPHTKLVVNPFMSVAVTGALSALPNRRFKLFLSEYGFVPFTANANTIAGSVFHRLVEQAVVQRKESIPKEAVATAVREHFRRRPWERIAAAEVQAIDERVSKSCEEITGARGIWTSLTRDLPRRVEQHGLNTRLGVSGMPDLEYAGVVAELKSGRLNEKHRQQAYLYLHMNGGQDKAVVLYRDSGFKFARLTPSDGNSEGPYGITWRGYGDYGYYRNQMQVAFLNDMLLPWRLFLLPDPYQSPDNRPHPSCDKYDITSCRSLAQALPLARQGEDICVACGRREPLEVMLFSAGDTGIEDRPIAKVVERQDLEPEKTMVSAAPVSRGAPLALPDLDPIRYVRWMGAMVCRQRYLAHLVYAHFHDRALQERKDAVRVIHGLRLEGPEDAEEQVFRFRLETEDIDLSAENRSDFLAGDRLLLVPVTRAGAQGDFRPVQDASGNARYAHVTLLSIDCEQVRVRIDGEFAQFFLGTEPDDGTLYSLEQSLYEDGFRQELRVLYGMLTCNQDPLRRLVMSDPSALAELADPARVDPTIARFWNDVGKVFSGLKAIDANKKDVVTRALQSPRYFLIQGPPGTGKTYSIILIAIYLLKYTRSKVRIATFTNRAALHILQTFLEWKNRIAQILGKDTIAQGTVMWAGRPRLLDDRPAGNVSACNIPDGNASDGNVSAADSPSVSVASSHPSGLYLFSPSRLFAEGFEAQVSKEDVRVLVGTVHTLYQHPLSSNEWNADDTVAIVDEASQLTEPLSLMALTGANRYFLVGDERQLSPVLIEEDDIPRDPDSPCRISMTIRDPVLNAMGISDYRWSLFERLAARAPPELQGMLTRNYRSRPPLVEFSSETYYEGRIEAVRSPAMVKGIDPILDDGNCVVLADIPRGSDEARESSRQAEFVAEIYQRLLERYPPGAIMVITPFNRQVARILDSIRDLGPDVPLPSVTSIDKAQGRESPIVILNVPCDARTITAAKRLREFRSSADGRPYMVDKKLNVALTRARERLFIVLDASALRAGERTLADRREATFTQLLDFLDRKHREGDPSYAFLLISPHW